MAAHKPTAPDRAAIAFLGLISLSSCAEDRHVAAGGQRETYLAVDRQIADHLRKDARLHPQHLMHARSLALIRFHIRADGTIEQVEVVKSSGFADADQYLANVVAHSGPFKPPRDYGVMNPQTRWVVPFLIRNSNAAGGSSP